MRSFVEPTEVVSTRLLAEVWRNNSAFDTSSQSLPIVSDMRAPFAANMPCHRKCCVVASSTQCTWDKRTRDTRYMALLALRCCWASDELSENDALGALLTHQRPDKGRSVDASVSRSPSIHLSKSMPKYV